MESLKLNKPHLIVMVGIPGSGKSFFAEQFSKTFNAPIISNDRIRLKLFKTPTFSNTENKIIDNIADYLLDEVLKTNRTVIYKGKTNLQSDRITIAKKARNAGYEPLYIWVQTNESDARKRYSKIRNNKAKLTVDQFNQKVKQFSPPLITKHVVVISGKHTYSSQLKIVLKHLVESHSQTGLNNREKNLYAHNSR